MKNFKRKIVFTSVPINPTLEAFMNAEQKRDEKISKLISIFPDDKEDIKKHIRDIETKTYGLDFCYEIALSGISWGKIKELL